MSEFEHDLRDMLARRADATPASAGDWEDLTVRMERRNRRSRRVLAGTLALVLVTGPLAGFAVARTIDDSEPTGRVTAGGPSGSVSDQVATAEGAGGLNRAAAVDMLGGIPLEKLFRRTTGSDIAIRGFISRLNGTGPVCQGDGWCPPVDCYPTAMIVGELSSEGAVGVANGSHYAAVTTDLKVTGGGVFGASGEEAPARWVMAQTSDRVAKVRVSFDGGGNDEMATVDGVVILAAPTDPAKTGGKVEALDGSGSVIASADASASITTGGYVGTSRQVIIATDSGATSAATSGAGSAAADSTTTTVGPSSAATTPPSAPDQVPVSPEQSACMPPPPTLPAPGEQPADPAAARAEIEHAFAISLDGGYSNDEEKGAVVQDSAELAGVMEEIRTGSLAQQVKDASGQVTEIVFTSPTEAAVRYDINVAGSSSFPGRIGKALLLDGRWKVARVTACADIALAGVTCPPK